MLLAKIRGAPFKEIERLNIPVVQICTMITVAKEVGSLRAMGSGGIVSPTGNPDLPAEKEKEFRRELVLRALQILQEDVRD
jgi:betaine reductase